MSDPVAMVDLQRSISELERLMLISHEKNVKDLLATNISKLQEQLNGLGTQQVQPGPSAGKPKVVRCYDVPLTKYAWDQDDDYVRIYVKFKNLKEEHEAKMECIFDKYAFHFSIKGAEEKNYVLTIKNMVGEIDGAKSHFTTKPGKKGHVIINLAKMKPNVCWRFLTTQEVRENLHKLPKIKFPDNKEQALMQVVQMLAHCHEPELRDHVANCYLESRLAAGDDVDETVNMPLHVLRSRLKDQYLEALAAEDELDKGHA